jgi:hypothetical protein
VFEHSKMTSFKKLNSKIYEKTAPAITPDFTYWKQLSVSIIISNTFL